MEKENIIFLRDNEDYEYIYGVLILKGNVLDLKLLQNRINDMTEEPDQEDNGDDRMKAVLEKYKEEYQDLVKYIPYGNYDLEV